MHTNVWDVFWATQYTWFACNSYLYAVEFERVHKQWSVSCWTLLQQFEVDAFICQVRSATLHSYEVSK